MKTFKRSLGWSFGSNYFNLVVRFISVAWVARLLTPDEIGVFSIALAGFGFLQVFRDFGIGTYLVQHKQLNKQVVASALTVCIGICWLLAAVAYFASDAIGSFYGRTEVTVIFSLLAINLLIIPFGTINLALLKRKLMFKQVAMIEVFSAIVGSVSVVIFAYHGYSYLSPVYGSIAGCTATILASNFFRQAEMPLFPGLHNIKSVFKFGGLLSTANIISLIENSGPELIIGKLMGMEAVAYFNKGFSTALLFNRLVLTSIQKISGSFFAQLNRTDKEKLRKSFIQLQDYIVIISWPFFAFMSIYAYEIITVLYGDQWVSSAELLPYFCIYIALKSTFSLFDQLLVTTGRVKTHLSILYKVILIQTLIVLYAATKSLELTVMMMICVPIIRMLLINKAVKDVLGTGLSYLNNKLAVWVSITAIFTTLIYLFKMAMVALVAPKVVSLIAAFCFAFVCWLFLIYLFKHPILEDIKIIFNDFRNKK
jgi:O-antigen/teichoic acid export membrane protein